MASRSRWRRPGDQEVGQVQDLGAASQVDSPVDLKERRQLRVPRARVHLRVIWKNLRRLHHQGALTKQRTSGSEK